MKEVTIFVNMSLSTWVLLITSQRWNPLILHFIETPCDLNPKKYLFYFKFTFTLTQKCTGGIKMKSGITITGSIIVDNIKHIRNFPEKGMLVNITTLSKNVGGCVPNTSINLAKLGGIPIKACGLVGDDDEGVYVKNQLSTAGVDISHIQTVTGRTSFTDVFNQADTKERTFFTYNGVNGVFSPAHIDEDALNCQMMHFGYLLLLEAFDASDPEYGTTLARYLSTIQKQGITTSIDVVSDLNPLNYQKIVVPAIPYCDYVIINEIEAGFIAKMKPRDENNLLLIEKINLIAKKILELGAKKVFIHCPEAGFAMDESQTLVTVPSHDLPKDYIVGTVGAGDAFCAGILYAMYHNHPLYDALVLGISCATANLATDGSTSGALSYEETIKLNEKFPRRKLKF